MNLDPLKVFQTILNIGAKPAMQQLQRHELVIRVLKDLNLDPTQPPDDVDGVYAYALVEYGVGKPEPILKLLREKEIKDNFWDNYISKSPLFFLKQVESFLEKNNSLKDEIKNFQIQLDSELEKFGEAVIDVAKRTRSKKFQPYPTWNMDYYPAGYTKDLIKEKIGYFVGVSLSLRHWKNS